MNKKLSSFFLFVLLLITDPSYAKITVTNAWARVTPSGSGAVFMTIENNSEKDDALLSASSENTEISMIHKTVRENNIAKMQHVTGGIKIPNNEKVNLKPGGYHIMLMGLNNKPALNDRIHLNLSFENHEDITINPIVKLRPPMMNKHE